MLLVYGPRSTTYDFGPAHPLTPRRFGPGMDLLRTVGAEPGLAPEPAPDEELLWCHEARYLETVKRLSADPFGAAAAGIGRGGDDPAFPGMHDAAAAVAGGSLRALEAILRGNVEHAFHPGGGLHHAMPDHASGFCIYDDPAIAIARARRDELRVLYLDFDVHHGDGVQAIHYDDPGVLTLSFHESGHYLFPGSGFLDELGEGAAAGTSVNVPMEPETGEGAWLDSVALLVPEVAAAFSPDLIVSQHGADSHAWDPLAHLRMTTTAMGAAARLVDAVAHRYSGGRWLATGGGGYDAYRVVPRMWSLVWLAGAHREVPTTIDAAWRDRWAAESAEHGQTPPPTTFHDDPNAGLPLDWSQETAEDRTRAVALVARQLVVPRLLREARDQGWWSGDAAGSGAPAGARGLSGADGRPTTPDGSPTILESVEASRWEAFNLAPRVVAPADPLEGHALIAAALGDGAHVAAAVTGSVVVGLAVTDAAGDLLALGIAPMHRRGGLAGRLLAASPARRAGVTLAERDPFEPLDRGLRATIARRLLERAGFRVTRAPDPIGSADPYAIQGER